MRRTYRATAGVDSNENKAPARLRLREQDTER